MRRMSLQGRRVKRSLPLREGRKSLECPTVRRGVSPQPLLNHLSLQPPSLALPSARAQAPEVETLFLERPLNSTTISRLPSSLPNLPCPNSNLNHSSNKVDTPSRISSSRLGSSSKDSGTRSLAMEVASSEEEMAGLEVSGRTMVEPGVVGIVRFVLVLSILASFETRLSLPLLSLSFRILNLSSSDLRFNLSRLPTVHLSPSSNPSTETSSSSNPTPPRPTPTPSTPPPLAPPTLSATSTEIKTCSTLPPLPPHNHLSTTPTSTPTPPPSGTPTEPPTAEPRITINSSSSSTFSNRSRLSSSSRLNNSSSIILCTLIPCS
ncbi:hypothetical protein BDY24DRAFT_382114 [Mrakia frigida]|uniref:uncharacterized protein n=1 Tax=Mrakia frigida TaxID=29902 RepID=UPI003FCBFF92